MLLQAHESHGAAMVDHSHLTNFNLFYNLKYSQSGLDIMCFIGKLA